MKPKLSTTARIAAFTLITCALIVIAMPVLYAQKTQKKLAVKDSTYIIKLKDLAAKENGEEDTIQGNNGENFTIKIDTTRAGDTLILKSILYHTADNVQDITNTYMSGTYTFSKKAPVALTFKTGKPDKKITTKETKIKFIYKSVTGKEVDTIVDKKDTLLIFNLLAKRSNALPEQKDTTVIVTKTEKDTSVDADASIVFTAPPQTEMEKQVQKINDQLTEMFAEHNKKAIGYFTLKDKKVPVFEGCISRNQDIKRVEITVSDGCIIKKGLMVELSDGSIFRNSLAPISLYRFKNRTTDVLQIQENGNKTIQVGDMIRYNFMDRFHYPDDNTASLTPDKMVDSIYNATTISDNIDVTVYSDLLGLLGRKANGIIQTEVSGRFITNTRNWKNADVSFLSYIKPYFRYAKFDSRFAQIDSTIIHTDSIYNRLYLTQIGYLQAGFKLNLFTIGLGATQKIYINAGMDINLTNADSLFHKDITTVNYYPEIEYTVMGLENFGMDISSRWMRQEFGRNSPFENRKGFWIFNPQVTVYYYPFSSPNKKIYLRYSNYAEIGGGKNNFGQFQFGFKTNLFGKKDQ